MEKHTTASPEKSLSYKTWPEKWMQIGWEMSTVTEIEHRLWVHKQRGTKNKHEHKEPMGEYLGHGLGVGRRGKEGQKSALNLVLFNLY